MNTHRWPHRIFGVVVLVLVAMDVMRGRFPAQPVGMVVGYYLAPLVWPRFFRMKSSAWSLLGLVLLGAMLFALSVAVGILLNPLGEMASRCYSDGLRGFLIMLFGRAANIQFQIRTAARATLPTAT